MKPRAITDLCQLSFEDIFKEISEGLSYIHENCMELKEESKALTDKERKRGAAILDYIAKEEATKFLILIDAVRCLNNQNKKEFSKQLKNFNRHISKGIYIRYYEMRPATFKEVKETIELLRKKLFLDGPQDVNWIFRNEILEEREKLMYVDYVKINDDHKWFSPNELRKFKFNFNLDSTIINLIDSMTKINFDNKDVLKIINNKWNNVKIDNNTDWAKIKCLNRETIKTIKGEGFKKKGIPEVYNYVINKWLFPISSLDLYLKDVDKAKLKKLQQNWTP